MTQDAQPDTTTIPNNPGSCALRLLHITHLPSHKKKSLLRSLASDISTTFILIAQHAESGILTRKHTGPINAVIETIKETEIWQREMLEDCMRKYKRRIRRMKREKVWVRGKLGHVVRGVHEMVAVWRERGRRFESLVEELAAVRQECELLRASCRGLGAGMGMGMDMGVSMGFDGENGVRIASPMEVDGGEREGRVNCS